MSSPVVTAAPSIDFKTFFCQAQTAPKNLEIQETISELHTIIKEYTTGTREIPEAVAELSKEEKVAKLEQLKALVAALSSKIPTPEAPKLDLDSFKAQIPAEFDLAKFKAEHPNFDFEAVKAKLAAKEIDVEQIKARLADYKRAQVTTTEVTVPKDLDVAAIVEKAMTLLKTKPAEPAAGQLSPELMEKVKALLAARKAEDGGSLKLPEGPEAEAMFAKLREVLATLGEDPSFASLSFPEKVKIVAAKVNQK